MNCRVLSWIIANCFELSWMIMNYSELSDSITGIYEYMGITAIFFWKSSLIHSFLGFSSNKLTSTAWPMFFNWLYEYNMDDWCYIPPAIIHRNISLPKNGDYHNLPYCGNHHWPIDQLIFWGILQSVLTLLNYRTAWTRPELPTHGRLHVHWREGVWII